VTKLRAPVSIENTLYRVLGELGIERAAEVTGKAESYLRALSDPDKRERLTVEEAVKLDLACAVAGDDTRPLYTTMGLLLEDAMARRYVCAVEIGRSAQLVAIEGAEAAAALFAAALDPTGDPKLRERALREAEEAHEAVGDAIQVLRASSPGGPSP